ncbi:hypothetical protein Saro_0627 [Novosphingobium aromaticivorans DSM 12444]|uniref:Uncharacterized protein n=1 Tax=Novosphingobium aromaticivorans (strain ATCC 700278 / DSM 12444 / CCUG 56034 / CIP 105152 / NBRC 16084 / F199) TaxID=279238 RepID=Q2GAP9_NOVAD|nr:hypothetical protein [Novosphingobium aromaticivorans]ABD25074.1 hypothetical protein Saro_0627 [Novosphingobium aromaticivorans DSM 12444]
MAEPHCPRCDDTGFCHHASFRMYPCAPRQEARVAIAAAEAAANAAAELLRFAREGEDSSCFAFAEETVALLASAMQAALRLEYPRACILAAEHEDQTSPEAINQMLGALTRFLEVFEP